MFVVIIVLLIVGCVFDNKNILNYKIVKYCFKGLRNREDREMEKRNCESEGKLV